ncbi:MAG: TlpA family protein disulfide reductase [Treponemataceae bacterium]
MKRIVLSLIFSLLSLNIFAQTLGINVGNLAPEFVAARLDSSDAKLSNYEGSIVVINFWTTWSPPCETQMAALQNIYAKYGDKIKLLAVNVGEEYKPVKKFISKNKFTFNVLFDKQSTLATKYNVLTFPAIYIIDQKGIIVHTRRGEMPEEEIGELLSKLLNAPSDTDLDS